MKKIIEIVLCLVLTLSLAGCGNKEEVELQAEDIQEIIAYNFSSNAVQDDNYVSSEVDVGVYKGAVYESIVGEALYKNGYSLFYYKREDGTLEQDFFIRDENHLIPIEVKARDGRTQSMKSLINNDKYADISWGIKLSLSNIGFENNVYTFPYFCTFLLRDWLIAR